MENDAYLSSRHPSLGTLSHLHPAFLTVPHAEDLALSLIRPQPTSRISSKVSFLHFLENITSQYYLHVFHLRYKSWQIVLVLFFSFPPYFDSHAFVLSLSLSRVLKEALNHDYFADLPAPLRSGLLPDAASVFSVAGVYLVPEVELDGDTQEAKMSKKRAVEV